MPVDKANKKAVFNKYKKTNCKVCSHKHLLEIEIAFIIEQKTSREIAAMIDDNGWDSISYVTLLTHMKEHVDEKRELVVKYLHEKEQLLDGTKSRGKNDIEIDESAIRLISLKKLDESIMASSGLQKQCAKAIQEQLNLRIESEQPRTVKDSKTKVMGTDRKLADKNKAYVPLQQVLVTLYKVTSEELRMTIKAKLEVLGVDSDSKKTETSNALIDLILENRK